MYQTIHFPDSLHMVSYYHLTEFKALHVIDIEIIRGWDELMVIATWHEIADDRTSLSEGHFS